MLDRKRFVYLKQSIADNISIDPDSGRTEVGTARKVQQEFFEKGEKYIKPMKMKDIAEILDFHESTISRGVNGKYMLTPFGLYEFKYFFSSSIETADDNSASSISIKKIIKDKIKCENKKKPLSDDQIAKLLNSKGVNIARRTVAKYREELGILSSSKRKQY